MMYKSTIIEKINKLAGFLDPNEVVAAASLEDEIEDLKMETEFAKETLQLLQMQLDASKTEHDTQKAIYESSVEQDLDKAKKKSSILTTYLRTITEDDGFLLNQLVRQIDEDNNQFWLRLKPIHDRAMVVKGELEELRELQKKCDEIKQQISG